MTLKKETISVPPPEIYTLIYPLAETTDIYDALITLFLDTVIVHEVGVDGNSYNQYFESKEITKSL